jgi:hypothetical protein
MTHDVGKVTGGSPLEGFEHVQHADLGTAPDVVPRIRHSPKTTGFTKTTSRRNRRPSN